MGYKVVELFAGIGGMTKAFNEAGAQVIWANDIDEIACEVYKTNNTNVDLIQGDIRGIDLKKIPDFDILLSSFPIPHLLTMATNAKERYKHGDPLVVSIFNVIKSKEPKAFLLETSKGLLAHDKGKTFKTIKVELERLGFEVFYKVLNIKDFGNIPHQKERMYIVGFKRNTYFNKFSFPEPIELTRSFFDIVDVTKKQEDHYYIKENNKSYYFLKENLKENCLIYKRGSEFKTLYFRNNKVALCPAIYTFPIIHYYIKDDFGMRKLTVQECFDLHGYDGYKIPDNIRKFQMYRMISGASLYPIVHKIANNMMKAMNNKEVSLSNENEIHKQLGTNTKSLIIDPPNQKRLIIAIQNQDGTISLNHIQPFNEWINGNRNVAISNSLYGKNLFEILHEELGYIQLNNEGVFQLRYVIDQNAVNTAMRMLGNIAEAIIVKRCNKYKKVNRKWATIGRKGVKKVKSLDNYIAIGTGLLTTRKRYKTKYDSTNPQRDIIWVDKCNPKSELLQINGNANGGISAGLQIKVSNVGKNYVLDDLEKNRYEVPMVYFGMNNDFDEIANILYFKRADVIIGKDFINVKAIDIEAFEELKNYYPIVKQLLEGKMNPIDLFSDSFLSDEILKTSIIRTAIESKKLNAINVFS